VQDNNVNAFCMPGGKIVVYEGLLPVTKDEASLAIVLGHEIAHAVAKHSAEQMSKQIKQQYGTQIGGAVLGALGMGENTASILSTVVLPAPLAPTITTNCPSSMTKSTPSLALMTASPI